MALAHRQSRALGDLPIRESLVEPETNDEPVTKVPDNLGLGWYRCHHPILPSGKCLVTEWSSRALSVFSRAQTMAGSARKGPRGRLSGWRSARQLDTGQTGAVGGPMPRDVRRALMSRPRRRRWRFRRSPSSNMSQLASTDGAGPSRMPTDEELAEMERSAEAHEQVIADILVEEEETLRLHVVEVLATGSTTLRKPTGTFTVTLTRPRRGSGELCSEGHRLGGRIFRCWSPVARSDFDSLGSEVVYRLAEGV